MTDFSRVAVGLFLVLNAPGALGAFAAIAPRDAPARLRLVGGVLAIALGALVVAAVLSDPFLDWLHISPETFQVAAGIVMLTLGLRLLFFGEMGPPSATSPLPGALSLVLGPVLIVAMLSYSARFGTGTSLGAAVLAVVVSGCLLTGAGWLSTRIGSAGRSAVARFSGALIVLLAIQLMVDGIQSV